MNRRQRCRFVAFGLITALSLHAPLALPDSNGTGYALAEDHGSHRHGPGRARPASREGHRRSLEQYVVPDVTLINQDGKKVRLQAVADSGKPVLLNFIFTTCTTICPPMAAGFARFQEALGPEAAGVTLLSVSIDPDHDTPAVMKAYLERFGARPGWELLTGRPEDVARIMKAFDAYVTNKMSHYPLTFLHAPGSPAWVRIDGVLGTSELVAEYRNVTAR